METVIPWQRRFSCHSGALQASISEDRFLSHSSWAVMESFWSSLWLTVLNHSDDSYLLSCSELSFFLCIFTITFIFLSVILLHLNVSHQECTLDRKNFPAWSHWIRIFSHSHSKCVPVSSYHRSKHKMSRVGHMTYVCDIYEYDIWLANDEWQCWKDSGLKIQIQLIGG